MGYDMYMVHKPEGEDERVAEIRKEIDAARERYGKIVLSNSMGRTSVEAEEASEVVEKLYTVLHETQKSYFRANIWGMEVLRNVMFDFGMIYVGDKDDELPEFPDFPEVSDPEESDILEEMIYSLRDDTQINIEDAPPHLAMVANVYNEQRLDALTYHPRGGSVIPLHKLTSNDGWVVSTHECAEALKAYVKAIDDRCTTAVFDKHFPAKDFNGWYKFWENWVVFLRTSMNHGGFRVW